MKYKKSISILTVLIAALSLIAAICGILPGQGANFDFTSLHGQAVTIYGRGVYQNDSASVAAQAIGQDIVTIILGIPLLLISLYLARKGRIKGKLLLTGALGYFLYTYVSYSFLSMYNSFFLIYAAIMSMSFFAFILSMMSYNLESLNLYFRDRMPVKPVGGLLIFIACILGLMWMKMIITPLISGTVPSELEHYTTLTIQALDLGFVVPTAILSGILLIKRRSFGYLLATVISIKETTLLAAITAMIISQEAAGIHVGGAVIAAFSLFDLIIIACLVIIIRNVKENVKA
jgi:hypothetical protein